MAGIFAMMVIPGNFDTAQGEHTFYGALTVVKTDSMGNPVFSQTVHNQLVNTGEDFILDQVFQDGNTANADNVQIGAICVSDAASPTIAETETASSFDTANGLTTPNCKEDTTVTTTSSVATIGPLTFAAGNTNVPDGTTVTAIGICQNDVTDDNDFTDCATEGILFAVVDVTNTQLNTGETVDITYTFDITSASS